MDLKAFIRRSKLRLSDALRYSHAAREGAGWLHLARGLLASDPVERGSRLARALSFARSNFLIGLCIRFIHRNPGIKGKAEIWSQIVRGLPRYRDLIKTRPLLDRSIILKAPRDGGEKGVLLMTFEYNWARLLLGLSEEEFRWVDEHFDLVLSTSWSPTDYAVLALALSKVKGTIFVQSCNYTEIDTIERFDPRLKCLSTLPCDWINPSLYQPRPPAERTTDIVMVANWGEFKRHWDLFRALAHMPAALKVVLIGQKEGGRTIETLRALARDFGVPQQLEFIESVPIEEVARQQCQAKVSLIMTRREGCCVAAVESLFAGCALAMRDDAHVGPLAYINERTGQRLRPDHLAEDLMELIAVVGRLEPRNWAVEHVAGEVSRKKLDQLLEHHARSIGQPWTAGVVQPQWRPHPTFANEADREAMRFVYETLTARFPKVFGPDLITESWR
ncbi:MAG: hypothetical protein JNM99_01460 [Verrucomicrobiaceae bacterium]|nr:hypothetical protein [Verrucomicrobiaceae bacterium]